MKRILVVFLTIALVLASCGAQEGIEVRDAWMRPAMQGANGAVYFVILNRSSEADELVGISTKIVDVVEMHESSLNGDVMQMKQVASVPLPAGADVLFEPGGLHIMLVGLKQEVVVGDEIEVTLQFQNSEDLTLRVPVSDMPVHEENH